MSALLEMLGCRYPIIQGPIAAMNSPRLTAAVCEAGAFGMIALGFSSPEETKKLVDGVRELTDKPFGANIMIMNPANPEILKILAAAGVKTVTTSAGSPAKIYPLLHELGMKGLHVLLALPHAIRAASEGVDGLVVSGSESGGLRSMGSESSSMVLVPLVADHVKIPVVAAGGYCRSARLSGGAGPGGAGCTDRDALHRLGRSARPAGMERSYSGLRRRRHDAGTPDKHEDARHSQQEADRSVGRSGRRSIPGIQSDERPKGLDERRLRSLPCRRRPGGLAHQGDQASQGHY